MPTPEMRLSARSRRSAQRYVLLLRAKRYAAVTAMPNASGVTTVLSICVQVARVSGALRDRSASSAGMTSTASSRIERNTWA